MSENPFDHGEINDLIHSRLRLGVMAYLSTAHSAIFGELKAKVNASDGNLSVQLKKLDEAGYITIEKKFVGKKPQTTAILTDKGRQAWLAYLAHMRSMLDAAE
ncbi:winged helix-turn-helix domain-containing protein [Hirschia litorea]|uniref:Winged helix-turn-helix domain-containing protein n=1 Tax=Hirschia litorea TaxID=1199156 RepID=A0ABW2IKT2_9PROT